GRDSGVYITMVVEVCIVNADGQQLVDEYSAEVFLLLGRGAACGCWIGLGVDLHVAEEALLNAGYRDVVDDRIIHVTPKIGNDWVILRITQRSNCLGYALPHLIRTRAVASRYRNIQQA